MDVGGIGIHHYLKGWFICNVNFTLIIMLAKLSLYIEQSFVS